MEWIPTKKTKKLGSVERKPHSFQQKYPTNRSDCWISFPKKTFRPKKKMPSVETSGISGWSFTFMSEPRRWFFKDNMDWCSKKLRLHGRCLFWKTTCLYSICLNLIEINTSGRIIWHVWVGCMWGNLCHHSQTCVFYGFRDRPDCQETQLWSILFSTGKFIKKSLQIPMCSLKL